uniref:Uncharacterized protein n=1 Tax=Anguilla anguilla TaxID=7936 RepID=A0A0E9VK94_ANGAN
MKTLNCNCKHFSAVSNGLPVALLKRKCSSV